MSLGAKGFLCVSPNLSSRGTIIIHSCTNGIIIYRYPKMKKYNNLEFYFPIFSTFLRIKRAHKQFCGLTVRLTFHTKNQKNSRKLHLRLSSHSMAAYTFFSFVCHIVGCPPECIHPSRVQP